MCLLLTSSLRKTERLIAQEQYGTFMVGLVSTMSSSFAQGRTDTVLQYALRDYDLYYAMTSFNRFHNSASTSCS